jgi:two-component system, chemotaxis family, protein-glutamate methylesterase/glutaminase
MRDLEIIVIGGSAGALEPLLEILATLPPAVTAPVAIVVHLAPRHPSLLPGLIARASSRPIHEPEDKAPLCRGEIYVAPPNYHMLVERRRTISLSVDDPVNFSRPSIDVLFESAACAFGTRVAGLVLSGTNADGAAGLGRIAGAGGVALVQALESAEHPFMPSAAAQRAGAVHALAPREVGPFLASLPSSSSAPEPSP